MNVLVAGGAGYILEGDRGRGLARRHRGVIGRLRTACRDKQRACRGKADRHEEPG